MPVISWTTAAFENSWCDRSGSAAKRCEVKLHRYQGASFAEVESGASFVRETWGGNGRGEAILGCSTVQGRVFGFETLNIG